MSANVHSNNVTEAQCAVLKAITPILLAMTAEQRQRDVIGNANLPEDLDRALKVIARTEENMARQEKKIMPLLVFSDQSFATVTLDERHEPATFWRDTLEPPARYVWPEFVSGVVAKAKPHDPSGIIKIPYAPLLRPAKVRDILNSSGIGNFDPTDLCAIIAAMIAKQPNGEPGDLLSDGKANLFPCGSLLVSVRRDGVDRGWGVGAWDPRSGVGSGRRVFSATC